VVALGQLYDCYVTLAFGIAKRILGDGDGGVEDVVQLTFLNLWRAASTYQTANLAGLVARIARNAALDAVRRRRPNIV
jgi:RNA polymerase sigma factor (sigma-70 family)